MYFFGVENTQLTDPLAELLVFEREFATTEPRRFGHCMVFYPVTEWRDMLKQALPDTMVLNAPKKQRPVMIRDNERVGISISHTEDYFAFLESPEIFVGVDIEKKGREVSKLLAQRMHCADDEHSLDALATWTLKEAYLKALGTGLRFPMNKVCLLQEKADDRQYLMKSEKGEHSAVLFETDELYIACVL